MTFAKNKLKKRTTSSFLIAILILLIAPVCLAQSSSQSQDAVQIFQREMNVGPFRSAILMLGYSRDKADVDKLFDVLVQKANESYSNIDAQNPSGDVGKIIAAAGKDAVQVSPETVSAFEVALKVSKWSEGAFDITSGEVGDWRDIKVSKSSSTVKLSKAGMTVNLQNIAEGHVAEILIRLIKLANMNHALVKVGSTFRGMGQSINGPWKIEVMDNEGSFAHRAINLTVQDTGIATASAATYRINKLVDPRTKKQVEPKCRGIVVVAPDTATAQALANAAFVMGPQDGMKLISSYGKGLIVDLSGNFLRSQGF